MSEFAECKDRLDMRGQLERIDRARAEGNKFAAETQKLAAEQRKLAAKAINPRIVPFITAAAVMTTAVASLITATPVLFDLGNRLRLMLHAAS